MTKTIVTGGRTAAAACAAILTVVTAGCSVRTGGAPGVGAARETATSAAPAGIGATTPAGELTVNETPWWQVTTASPSPTPTRRDPPTPARGDRPLPPQRFVLSGGVLFEPDSPVLTPGASTQLDVILVQVQAHPAARIVVNGYTNADGSPESGALQLSVSRADTIKAWFVTNGIAAARITTRGWGDSHPIYAHPADDSQRAANRRCEITVIEGAR